MGKSESSFVSIVKPYRKLRVALAVAGATLALALLIFAWALANVNWEIGLAAEFLIKPQGVEFIVTSVASIILGIAASYVYGWLESKRDRSFQETIQSCGPHDLVAEALNLLQANKATLVYNKYVDITIRRLNGEKFLRMKSEFSYEKVTPADHMNFKVQVLDSEKSKREYYAEESTELFDSVFRTHELFYLVDEVELRKVHGDREIDGSTKLNYVKVNGVSVSLSGNAITGICSVALNPNRDKSVPVKVEYCVEFVVSDTDIQYVTLEFPTKFARFRFLRDETVRDTFGADAFEMMSATTGSASVREEPQGTHEVRHDGWMLPKSCVVFQWYPKI